MSPAAPAPPRTVDVETRAGTIAVDPADIVHFPHGVPGFESCRRFVVARAPEMAPFTCLHGLDHPHPSFLAIDPRTVVSDYALPLGAAERARLGGEASQPLVWLAIVRVEADVVTANLSAPIVIDPTRMRGLQVMAPDAPYAADHRLSEA
jgi:flagellar assembly factor FliW